MVILKMLGGKTHCMLWQLPGCYIEWFVAQLLRNNCGILIKPQEYTFSPKVLEQGATAPKAVALQIWKESGNSKGGASCQNPQVF